MTTVNCTEQGLKVSSYSTISGVEEFFITGTAPEGLLFKESLADKRHNLIGACDIVRQVYARPFVQSRGQIAFPSEDVIFQVTARLSDLNSAFVGSDAVINVTYDGARHIRARFLQNIQYFKY